MAWDHLSVADALIMTIAHARMFKKFYMMIKTRDLNTSSLSIQGVNVYALFLIESETYQKET